MPIRLTCGTQQRFRYRYVDLTIRGQVDDLEPPVRQARYTLNRGPKISFYAEAIPDDGVDWVNGYKASPAELRCRDLGEFCIEIPANTPALRNGQNQLSLDVEDGRGQASTAAITFSWDPTPLPMPLDLRDLTRFEDIQQVGQIVNGAFDLDRKQNLIRSQAPVAPDAFLVLGYPTPTRKPPMRCDSWTSVAPNGSRSPTSLPPSRMADRRAGSRSAGGAPVWRR